MKKPLILIDALAFDPQDAGFSTAIRSLVRTCSEIDAFNFIVAHHIRHASFFENFGIAQYPVKFPYKLRYFASIFLLPLIARELCADLIHCEITAVPLALKIPATVTVHDLHFVIDRNVGQKKIGGLLISAYWRKLYVPMLRKATLIKSISQTTADDIHRLIGKDLPVMVIDPRIDPPKKEPRLHSWPDSDTPVRLLFIGSVVPRKNLPYLISALSHVKRPWQLDIAGNLWWGVDALEPVINDPRVYLHGYVSQSKIEELIDSADLLVSPSVYEGFGLPLAEAMVRGLPVIASDIPVFNEFVPRQALFQIDDPTVLTSLIDNMSTESYALLNHACSKSVERFTPARHIEGHRRLFETALAADEQRKNK